MNRFIYLLLIIFAFDSVDSEINKGVITLDELTFDKVVPRFNYVLVKFAHAFPYGEDHDNYVRVAQSIANFTDIIVINLEIKDYGERDSYALAQRYRISDKQYPALRLFTNANIDNPIVYEDPERKKDDELNANRIKLFLRKHTGYPITLDNCTQHLDILAESFVKSTAQEERQELLDKTKESVNAIKKKKEKNLAHNYIMLMEKGLERGNKFFESEETRIKALLNGKLTNDKKSELKARLNILQSFLIVRQPKDEL